MDITRGILHSLWGSVYSLTSYFRKNRLDEADVESLATYMSTAKNIIVMTGAGISTNAGIPDFRSESFGLYNRLQKYNLPHPTAVFTLDYFKQDPRPFYDIAKELYPVLTNAKPTVAHYFIKLLEQKGVLLRHYTQNIDCLEDLTQMEKKKTIQAHGHIRSGRCLDCEAKYSFDHMKNAVLAGQIPKCTSCQSGVVKPDVVLFGEGLPSEFWKYLNDFPKCDLLIIMGTSLVVQPFAGLANKVDSMTPRLLLNRDPVGDPNMFGSFLTSALGLNPNFGSGRHNSKRDVFLQGDCDEGCMRLAALLGWESELRRLIDESNRRIDAERSILQQTTDST